MIQPDRSNQVLPRTWNKHLLPGYEVIAVDERDPEYPDMIVIGDSLLPRYNHADELWRDPHYVRYQRLSLESAFLICAKLNSTSPREASVQFGRFLEQAVYDVWKAAQNGEPDAGRELGRLQRVWGDYDSNPWAVIHSMS